MKNGNLIYERAKCNQRHQLEVEEAQEYIDTVIKLAKTCNYGSLEEGLIQDRLVVGVRHKNLSESLQMDENLALEKQKIKFRNTKV